MSDSNTFSLADAAENGDGKPVKAPAKATPKAPAKEEAAKSGAWGTPKTIKMDEVLFLPALQSRHGGVDEGRVQQLRAVVRDDKKKLPRMRAYEITEEGHRYNGKFVCVGGFHRGKAHQDEGVSEAYFEVRKGTWADAVRAAAVENIEHDTAGRYRTNEDKRKGILMYCATFEGMPKSRLPKYREIARLLAVSHTFVADMDPFGTGKDAKAADEGKIMDRSEPRKKKKRKASIKVFAWKDYDAHVGWLSRGIDTVCETYGIGTNSAPAKEAHKALATLDEIMKRWFDKYEQGRTEGAPNAELGK